MSPSISANRPARQAEPSFGSDCNSAPVVAAPPQEPDYAAVHAANTPPPDLRRFLEARMQPANLAAPEPLGVRAATDPIAAKLDEIEKRFAGPYRVPGRTQLIPARATFHSANPKNVQLAGNSTLLAQARRACHTPELHAALNACMHARPTPAQLVRVTQALIDAGALDGLASIGSQDVRALQQRFCIGIDCIGYVSVCERALHGARFDQARKKNLFVQQLETSGLYEKREGGLRGVGGARPGDVLHLRAAPSTENREHNVVVRKRDTLTSADSRWGSLALGGQRLMAGGGPVHLLDIVQSGGGSDDVRGVRHQMWLYDESSDLWGAVDAASKQITLFAEGPQEHPRGDVFTPRKPVR